MSTEDPENNSLSLIIGREYIHDSRIRFTLLSVDPYITSCGPDGSIGNYQWVSFRPWVHWQLIEEQVKPTRQLCRLELIEEKEQSISQPKIISMEVILKRVSLWLIHCRDDATGAMILNSGKWMSELQDWEIENNITQ